MKEAVAGELARPTTAPSSTRPDDDSATKTDASPSTSRASSASATASTAPSTTPTRPGTRFPEPRRLSHRRDHPQPPRQRAAARASASASSATRANRDALGPDDVVILPAFGVTVATWRSSRRTGCTLVDTTCGSVLNVWKNVVRYAREASPPSSTARSSTRRRGHRLAGARSTRRPLPRRAGSRRSRRVCEYIRGGAIARRSSRASRRRSRPASIPTATSRGSGCANQTTMLMSESLEIGEMLGAAMRDRYGEAALAAPSAPSTRSAARPRTGRTRSIALLDERAGST